MGRWNGLTDVVTVVDAAVKTDCWEAGFEEQQRHDYNDSIHTSEKFLGIVLDDWEFGGGPVAELAPRTRHIQLIN